MKKVLLLIGCGPVLFFGFVFAGMFTMLAVLAGGSLAAGEDTPIPVESGRLLWPVVSHLVTSNFGDRVPPDVGNGLEVHTGIDIAANLGEPVEAAHAGKVTTASWSGGYGNLLVLRRSDGLVTYYGHLSAYAVAYGDTVVAGQVIGFAGSTGRSTGPHVHFEVRPTGAEPVDPLIYLSPP